MCRPSLTILAAFTLLAAPFAQGASSAALPDGLYAWIETPRGVVTCELHYQKAPLTVANFVGLAEGTLGPVPRKPYFDGLKFHRVVSDFVVQGGDPSGTGDGGPGYTFPDELVPGLRHDAAGVLSMANKGPDTNGSQFFLTLREVNRLNYLHSVFGRVVRGLEVLPQIRQGDTMQVAILRRGAAAQAFRADEIVLQGLAAKARRYSAALEPGPATYFDDPGKILPLEPPRAKYFNFKLANLERATGLRLVARLLPRATAESGQPPPGAFLRSLAGQLGLGRDHALAVYFAEQDAWAVWIGDGLAPRFAGKPGVVRETVAGGTVIEADDAFLRTAQAAGNADYRKQQKTAAAAKQPAPAAGQRVKLQTDAVLDSLIFRLEPAR